MMWLPAIHDSLLIAYVVLITFLVMLHNVRGLREVDDADEEVFNGIEDISLSTWQQSYNENRKLLVLFYQNEYCDDCFMAMDRLEDIVLKSYVPPDVKIAKSSCPELVSKLEINQFPSLIYLQDKSYLIYDGNFEELDVLQWLQLAAEKTIRRLDDESFEPVTQIASGAEAGDWLVAFYKEACKNILPVVESVSVRIRGKTNVAKVNIQSSPKLAERFKITECQEVILFTQGMMYKYHLPSLNIKSLGAFIQGDYKDGQGQPVPGLKQSIKTETRETVPETETGEMMSEPKTGETMAELKTEETVTEPKTEEMVIEHKTEEIMTEHMTEEMMTEHKTEESMTEPKTEEIMTEHKTEEIMTEHKTENMEDSKKSQEQPLETAGDEILYVAAVSACALVSSIVIIIFCCVRSGTDSTKNVKKE